MNYPAINGAETKVFNRLATLMNERDRLSIPHDGLFFHKAESAVSSDHAASEKFEMVDPPIESQPILWVASGIAIGAGWVVAMQWLYSLLPF